LTDLAADAIPDLTIAPNQPNPFSIATAIPYTLARASHTRATIHDVQGRAVRTLIDGVTPPGSSTLVWNGRDASDHPVPAGVYWFRMEAGPTSEVRKLIIVR
jgi:flagellar hook assembly protein FlgD